MSPHGSVHGQAICVSFKGDGSREVAPGDFSRTQVGDDSDTSPYRAQGVIGISTSVYIRNMSELIRYLEGK